MIAASSQRRLLEAREPVAAEPVHVPTLKICGEHETALGLELTESYDGLVDDFTLRRLAGASHWVQQEAPDAVNAALTEWLTARAGCGWRVRWEAREAIVKAREGPIFRPKLLPQSG